MSSHLPHPSLLTLSKLGARACPSDRSECRLALPHRRCSRVIHIGKTCSKIPTGRTYRFTLTIRQPLSKACLQAFSSNPVQRSAVRVTPSGNPRDLNFSRTVAGITKWFWFTIEGYLSYLLPKFEDLIPTSLGDIEI